MCESNSKKEEDNLSKIIETKYLIHCYRDEPFAHSGKRSILATASGSSPTTAFESLSYQYAMPIVDRLKRQYQHLFSR